MIRVFPFLFAILNSLVPVAMAVGLAPVPSITNAKITASAAMDANTNQYVYSYIVSSGDANVGEIWDIKIDVSFDQSTNGIHLGTFGLTIPMHSTSVSFDSIFARLLAVNSVVSTPTALHARSIVPFGQVVPPGWTGGLGLDGYASFTSGDDTPNISPGTELDGFQLLSHGVPTIREVQLIPMWMMVVDNHDEVTEADMSAAGDVEQTIIFRTSSLGPSGVSFGSAAHWNQLRDDIAKAGQLGWIKDRALGNRLAAYLADARQAFNVPDTYVATKRLLSLQNMINHASVAQISPEGLALVALNIQSLIDNLGSNPAQPKIKLSPSSQSQSVGQVEVLSVVVVDLANGNLPMPDIPVAFRVTSGPNQGLLGRSVTDQQGLATLSYSRTAPGTDPVTAQALFFGGEVSYDDSAIVIWEGGVDLVVPIFSPPFLKTSGGRQFFLTEQTQNIGNRDAPASVTRYFISADSTFPDGGTYQVGQRQVPPLPPGQLDAVKRLALNIPDNLPEGAYFLAACADGAKVIPEADETNNCSYTIVLGRQSIVVPIERAVQPPDCTKAVPSLAILSPPNHRLVDIAIMGVLATDGGAVSLLITAITQDEPVNGLGEDDRSPDGFGIGKGSAQVRAERFNKGNGRVYAIAFTATDGNGATCTGSVRVGVPQNFGSAEACEKEHESDMLTRNRGPAKKPIKSLKLDHEKSSDELVVGNEHSSWPNCNASKPVDDGQRFDSTLRWSASLD